MKQITGLLLWLMATPLMAHQLSTAYLRAQLNPVGLVDGQLQVRMLDLEQAIGLDSDGDGQLRWGEVLQHAPGIAQYLLGHLQLSRGGQLCKLILVQPWQVDNHFNDGYLVLPLRAQCALRGNLAIHYTGFFAQDSLHKLLISVDTQGHEHSRVMSDDTRELSLNTQAGSEWATFGQFVYQGMVHIWMGLDHVLFLVLLLLTCVAFRENKRWVAQPSLRPILINITWIVSAFTLAHSLTLSLTALGIVQIPTRLVEAGIAGTLVFTAFNNLLPLFQRVAVLTFCFGLLHGMGFAGALGELGLPADEKLLTILAFNLGVEIGQLGIVLLVVPVLLAVRRFNWYLSYAQPLGSVCIGLLALMWMFQRLA